MPQIVYEKLKIYSKALIQIFESFGYYLLIGIILPCQYILHAAQISDFSLHFHQAERGIDDGGFQFSFLNNFVNWQGIVREDV